MILFPNQSLHWGLEMVWNHSYVTVFSLSRREEQRKPLPLPLPAEKLLWKEALRTVRLLQFY